MESFLFAVNAVMPIILTVCVGYFLKRIGLMDADFAKKANKLVFRAFLPAMLFLNVYKIEALSGIDLTYIGYVLAFQFAAFLVMIPAVTKLTQDADKRGVLLQASFRSNYALVGIPLATSLFGDLGAAVATLLSVALIPMINMLAVVSLTIFRDGGEGGKPSAFSLAKKIVLGIVKNPLIISIALGCITLAIRALFVKFGVEFRLSDVKPVYTVLNYLSSVATPLSLIVLGAQFEFSAVTEMKREIVAGVVIKGIINPLLAITIAVLFFRNVFGGEHFATFVAAFATPVAVSTVPMAQEMDGNVSLAGQLVVWSTVLSGFVIFFASFILKSIGIF